MKTKMLILWIILVLFLIAGSLASHYKKAAQQCLDKGAISSLLELSQKAVVDFTVDPSEKKFDEAAGCYLDNASKFSSIGGKSDYVVKRIYKKVVSENLQGAALANIRPKMDLKINAVKFTRKGATAFTIETWEGEKSFHTYKLKKEKNVWKIASESWCYTPESNT